MRPPARTAVARMPSRRPRAARIVRWQSPGGRCLRTAWSAIVWEAFKWLFGDPWRLADVLGTGLGYVHDPPFRAAPGERPQLPHLWDIARRAGGAVPAQRGHDPRVSTSWRPRSTRGVRRCIGFALGTPHRHRARVDLRALPTRRAGASCRGSSPARRCRSWRSRRCSSSRFGVGAWSSVVIIATYLTFFPVTIAMMRGLRSPDPRAIELMRSYAASRWAIYWKVRLPASVPYLFTALKIAATASVVGAIIGEGPGGIKDGLGRAIIIYNQQYITGPESCGRRSSSPALTGHRVLRARAGGGGGHAAADGGRSSADRWT